MAGQAQRLDRALVERALARTRTRAQRLIEQGAVLVNGKVARRSSQKITADDTIRTSSDLHYVSRGAFKLVGALRAFAPWGLHSPEGRDCLDIGASTGGFTQVLLENGARRVIALDVGHGQLDPRLARDPRVTNMEGCNIRSVHPADLPFVPTYIVSDVSFISLTYVLPVIARILSTRQKRVSPVEIIVLIKPQFEQGSRSALGKGGIVENPLAREQARNCVIGCARELGFRIQGCVDSPIEGEHGNREYLLWIRG